MKFVLRLTLAFLVATALVGLACSSSASRAGGATCSVDTDCASGSCLDLAVFDAEGGVNGQCRSAGKACSKACSIDGDCASLSTNGMNFKCFTGCTPDGGGPAPMSCGATL